MKIAEVVVHQLRLPLHAPYKVSFRTYNEFEPLFVEMRGDDGSVGWGEAYIPPGSTVETPESGWAFCNEWAGRLAGKSLQAAKRELQAVAPGAPFASNALLTAVAMLERHPALTVTERCRVPLLVPIAAKEQPAVEEEVERLFGMGYRTFKVKVGWDVDADLGRVSLVQAALGGRGEITMDANRGYTTEQGCRFAASLDPAGIALFEQPCGADEWDGNAAVAAVSKVPLMLDESIRGNEDVERAATIPGVKLVKVKMKRLGGIERTVAVMQRARDCGLDVCLGDGVATELLCWMEACVSRGYVSRAGDMNGFLKPRVRLFSNPLPFERGDLVLEPGFWPEIDRGVLEQHSVRRERHAAAAVAVS